MTDGVNHQPPPTVPAQNKSQLPPKVLAKINEQAQQFEAMFMSQMLQFMWSGIETNDYFGGGAGEDAWRGQLLQEYGSVSAKAGNLGIADAVRAELIKAQERIIPANALGTAVVEPTEPSTDNTTKPGEEL
jgi:flagellar protein FlgJ